MALLKVRLATVFAFTYALVRRILWFWLIAYNLNPILDRMAVANFNPPLWPTKLPGKFPSHRKA